jgi:hypothetical protein
MSARRWLPAGWAAAVLGVLAVGGAGAAGLLWLPVARGFWPPASADAVLYFYPTLQYLADALAAGDGVFWTRLQNCGQPAFGNGQVGALYPLNALFLVLDPRTALAATDTFHVLLGGLGMLYLARQLRLHPAAALTGALALLGCGATWMLAFWQPTVLAPFMWIPWALGVGERLLRGPRYATVVALGAVLTLQLLAGYPQTSLFTYQVLALRLLWELIASRHAQRWRRVAAVAVALVLPVGLAAVKLLPAIEFNRLSIRGSGLSKDDILVLSDTWTEFRGQLLDPLSTSFVVAPWGAGFVLLALFNRQRRRLVCFYLATMLLFVVLSFDNVVLDAYLRLPFATMFRVLPRFRWMASVLAALLVAVGTHVFLRAMVGDGRRRVVAILLPLLGIGGMGWLGGALPSPVTLGGSVGALAGMALATTRWRLRQGWRWCVPGGVGLALLLFVGGVMHAIGPSSNDRDVAASLWRRATELAAVRAAMTPQDRAYLFHDPRRESDWSVVPKSSSLFGIAGVSDYEPQTSLRFASYLLTLRGAGPYVTFGQFELAPRSPRRRALLDLVAARFVVLNSDRPLRLDRWLPPLREVARDGSFSVLENSTALPRAFYVPMAEVVADPSALLARLGARGHDPRRVALIETPPADGFLGTAPVGNGRARIVSDRSERLEIAVAASAAGFLFLSDQDYPGWTATVNGLPADIQRANYAFRLVRVPAGSSMVVFHYRPRPLFVGAAVSAATALVLCLIPVGGWALRARRAWV